MPVLIIAIVIALTAAGSGGAVYASQGALPGDTLYQVKTTLEDVQVSLAGSDEAKAQTYLELAAKRIAEIQAASAEGRPHAAGAAAEALTRQVAEAEQYVAQASASGRDVSGLAARLTENLERQQGVLAATGDRVPEQAKAALARAAEGARHGLTLTATRAVTTTLGRPEGGPGRPLTGTLTLGKPSSGITNTATLTVTVPGLTLTLPLSGTLPVSLTQTISDVARLASDPLVPGQSYNGLLAKLNAAGAALERGQAEVAQRQLDALMNELNAMERSGHVSADNYAALAARVQTLANALGGTPKAQATPSAGGNAGAANQPPSPPRRGR